MSTRPTSSSSSAYRRTLVVIRSDSSGIAISGRVADVRRDDAVGHRPQRMARRQRLGIGDVESGATDDAVAERVDEVVGDDVLCRGRR